MWCWKMSTPWRESRRAFVTKGVYSGTQLRTGSTLSALVVLNTIGHRIPTVGHRMGNSSLTDPIWEPSFTEWPSALTPTWCQSAIGLRTGTPRTLGLERLSTGSKVTIPLRGSPLLWMAKCCCTTGQDRPPSTALPLTRTTCYPGAMIWNLLPGAGECRLRPRRDLPPMEPMVSQEMYSAVQLLPLQTLPGRGGRQEQRRGRVNPTTRLISGRLAHLKDRCSTRTMTIVG